MPHPIAMPSFGMYTSEGTLVAWLCEAGTYIEQGQPVVAIETEKATHEVPAPASGILYPVASVGALLKEEAVAGYILAPGEAPPPAVPVVSAPVRQSKSVSSPLQPMSAAEEPAMIRATPLARRLAAQHRLDLKDIKGTGPGGRIGEADVMAALQATQTSASAPWRIRKREQLTGIRRTIGERLRRSVDTAVALTLTREVEAGRLVTARAAVAATLGVPVPFDALFVKLLAVALRECPTLNAVIQGDELLLLDEVNVGVAVSTPRGLIVPVVRDADVLSIGDISRRVRELAERARAGTITVAELDRGTATVTNLGDHGIDAFTPVLNPPQSTILGIGRIQPRPIVRDGAIVPAHTCVLSLTFDHRVEDGAPATGLLAVVARLMNDETYLNGLA